MPYSFNSSGSLQMVVRVFTNAVQKIKFDPNWYLFFIQEFFPLISIIFTSMKGTKSAKSKIPLLFTENDADVNKWI